MTPPRPLERELLAPAEEVLTSVAGSDQSKRLDALEGAAAVLGGCSLATLRDTDGEPRVLSGEEALIAGDLVQVALLSTPIHPALALTSLAQPPMSHLDRRRAGAYYTDFRLAGFLVGRLLRGLRANDAILDPASGTGALLVAAALSLGNRQARIDRFIAESVHAADLSADALRGVKLALASLTADDAAVEALAARLRRLDSLFAGPSAWEDVAPRGFRTVLGNPPWEKLKVTRHEHLAANGVRRHYGADYGDLDLDDLGEARTRMREYAVEISAACGGKASGEVDLYMLFLALAVQLAARDGEVAMLVPAGLIRSKGTEGLRRYLFDRSAELRLAVLDNRARFFGIDTRFKFLALHARRRATGRRAALEVGHASGEGEGVSVSASVRLGRAELRRLRPDLTVPEVRTVAEWRLFRRMSAHGDRLGEIDREWPLDIVRELDMTNDRDLLSREAAPGALPLIEGRMVHQFRSNQKAYVSGTGRGARWQVTDLGQGHLVPQFWVDPDGLSARARQRASIDRVGFCDITGQTNERAMLAARVPAGAICGNKVPTITFAAHRAPGEAADLWLAVANSFAFDWLLRRLMTTTVNYFVLRGVPFPSLTVDSPDGLRLIGLARLVDAAGCDAGCTADRGQLAEWRAEMDALVLRAYGLTPEDARIVLDDFPLLDRGQLPLPGESRSTVTRDLVLHTFARLGGDPADAGVERRLEAALLLGATAYVPAEAAKAKAQASPVAIG